MNLPKFILSVFLLITALGASGEKTRPPNFLILFADDISASHLGCYGSRNPDTTPNLDLFEFLPLSITLRINFDDQLCLLIGD